MAGVALLLKSRGFHVSGSDSLFYPPMSEQLKKNGVETKYFSPENVRDADFVVVGNAVARNNPEVQEAIALRKDILSYPDVINLEFQGKDFFVVAGTHGKTTTTSMLAFLLEESGFSPSFLVGGIPINFGVSAKVGHGDIFVIEGDEYDTAFFDKTPKFWHFRPKRAVMGKVELDHADIYKSFDDYKLAFQNFARIVEEKLSFFLSKTNLEIVSDVKAEKVSFSEMGDADFFPQEIKLGEDHLYSFLVQPLGMEMHLDIFGIHNITNSLASVSLLCDMIPPEKISEFLPKFRGVRRRLEVIFSSHSVSVIDDFAHHPTEVESGIKTIKEFFREVWVAFEPRSWTSRTKYHQEGFKRAFELADAVFIGKIYREEKIPRDIRLSPEDIVSHLRKKGVYAVYAEDVSSKILELLGERGMLADGEVEKPEKMKKSKEMGDIAIIFMSSGDFYGEKEKLISALGKLKTQNL